jgi:hypothetical protein
MTEVGHVRPLVSSAREAVRRPPGCRPVRRTINDDPYPLSPRLAPLKAILAKLNPSQPPSEPPPPLQARDAPTADDA